MVGLAESVLDLMAVAKFSNTGPNPAWTAIGEDSTTTPATGILMAPGFQVSNGQPMTNLAWLKSYPAVGRHVYAWLEKSTAAGTTTWYGDNNAPTQEQFGLTGTIH
jgi:hypothetical protein